MTEEERIRYAMMQQGGGRYTPMTAGMSVPQSLGDPASYEARRANLRNKAARSLTGEENAIKSQRAYADMLRGQGVPQGKRVGPYDVYVAPNWGEQVAYAGSQALGGYLSGRANRADERLDEERGLIKAAEQELEDMASDRSRQDELDAEERGRKEREARERTRIEERNEDRETDAANRATDLDYIGIINPDTGTRDTIRQGEDIPDGFMLISDYSDLLETEAKNTEAGYYEHKTKDERNKFKDGGNKVRDTQRLLSTYDDSYSANPVMRGMNAGELANWADRTLPFGDTDAAQWWSEAKRRELKPRHELFGSAFTKPEQIAYNQTTFSFNDKPEFIREQLKRRSDMELMATRRMAADYLMKGVDPKRVELHYGDIVDIDQLRDDLASGKYERELKKQHDEARKLYGQTSDEAAANNEGVRDAAADDSMPKEARDAGVPPEVWAVMTDEERQQWLAAGSVR